MSDPTVTNAITASQSETETSIGKSTHHDFTIVPNKLIDAKLPANVKMLWINLESHADGFREKLNQKALCNMTGLTDKPFKRARDILVQHNMIHIDVQWNQYGGERHAITTIDRSQWTGLEFMNDRSENPGCRRKSDDSKRRGCRKKSDKGCRRKSDYLKDHASEEKTKLVVGSCTTRDLTTSGQGKRKQPPKKSRKALQIEFNRITGTEHYKTKNDRLNPLIDRYERGVIMSFIDHAEGKKWLYGKNKEWDILGLNLKNYFERIYTKK